MQPELLKEIVQDDAFHRLYEEATQTNLGQLGSRGQFTQSPSSVQLESLLSAGIVRPSTVQRANERTGTSHPIMFFRHLYRRRSCFRSLCQVAECGATGKDWIKAELSR